MLNVKVDRIYSLLVSLLLIAGVNVCLSQPISYQGSNIKVLIPKLPGIVNETSGLILNKDKLLTHNDSKGAPELYRINVANNFIESKIVVSNATNVDWEEICEDESYIYVGDFGNNSGDRTDLKIYKIKKEVSNRHKQDVVAEIIRFKYPDHNSEKIKRRKNIWDCEAMIASGDSLYLFSKDWKGGLTRLFSLPKLSGNYIVNHLSTFNADGLITAATLDSENNQLALLGYKNYVPFIWIFSEFNANDFFSGNKFRLNFPEIAGAQTEGIAFSSESSLVFSCEATAIFTPKLFAISFVEFKGQIENFKKKQFAEFNIKSNELFIEISFKNLTQNKLKLKILDNREDETFSRELTNTEIKNSKVLIDKSSFSKGKSVIILYNDYDTFSEIVNI